MITARSVPGRGPGREKERPIDTGYVRPGEWITNGACTRRDAPNMEVDLRNRAAVTAALECCRRCKVHTECSTWLHSMPVTYRPIGVTAGEIWRYDPDIGGIRPVKPHRTTTGGNRHAGR